MGLIDFNNRDCTHSNNVRGKIKWLSTYILNQGMSTSMRKVSRETGIPRRTLHRYMIEYTVRLAECHYPDYNEDGSKVNYMAIREWILELIKHNKRKYPFGAKKRKTKS